MRSCGLMRKGDGLKMPVIMKVEEGKAGSTSCIGGLLSDDGIYSLKSDIGTR
jgi:hypothetical protein